MNKAEQADRAELQKRNEKDMEIYSKNLEKRIDRAKQNAKQRAYKEDKRVELAEEDFGLHRDKYEVCADM